MAGGTDISSDVGGDLAAHEGSYALFTKLIKWGTIASFLIAFIVVFGIIA